MKYIIFIVILNIGFSRSNNYAKSYFKINENNSTKFSFKSKKDIFPETRISVGGGIGILYGNKFLTVNLHSRILKDYFVTLGTDYYFLKNKEERNLENFYSPSLILSYNIATDREGNELLIGGGLCLENFKKLKPIISFKGNLYLKNSFYLGIEIRQPFLDPIYTNANVVGFFISPYIGINMFYKIIHLTQQLKSASKSGIRLMSA